MHRVTILGGGSFGTALADLLARLGHEVTFWLRDEAAAQAINATHHNPKRLSEFALHHGVHASSALQQATANADWLVVALPSHSLRQVLVDTPLPKVPLVLGSKGLEAGTLMTCAELVADVLGADWPVLALSGPSFAREIMLQHPTAVVLACADEKLAQKVAKEFFCESFRAYSSTDVLGVEMGGALKNVMAIAAGGVEGMGLGANTLAALVTRGIAETSRLAVARGANPLTLAGLAGVGDMVLTCTGALSRNRAVGVALGQGKSVEEAIRGVREVAEGVSTAKSAAELARRLGVDAPISTAVYRVLYEGLPAREAILGIVRREPGRE